jgi:outer membrane protein OmpA-like peptidoglycan-associated protein
MSRTHRLRFSRIAILASAAVLLLAGPVPAQTVAVFDDAPSIEQLRSIMVPESHPGSSRSIVLQLPDSVSPPPAVQQVSTEAVPAPRRRAASMKPASGPIVRAAASMPAQKPNPTDEAGAVAFHVNFDFNSAVLPESAHEMIGLIAQLMKETPNIKIRVEGHTDAVGSAAYNVILSERRALSVGDYLIQQGIDASRLEMVGRGMAEPLTRNKYDPANRRVQFARIG